MNTGGDLPLGTIKYCGLNYKVFLYENDWYGEKEFSICIRYRLDAIDAVLFGRTELKSLPKKIADKTLDKLVESALSYLKTETNERLQRHKIILEKEQKVVTQLESFIQKLV